MNYKESLSLLPLGKRLARSRWQDGEHVIHRGRLTELENWPDAVQFFHIMIAFDPFGGYDSCMVMPYKPRPEDIDATDWEVYELPKGYEEIEHRWPFN